MAIPSSTRFLRKVRKFVVRHAIAAELPEKAVEHVKMCVDEACTNVIEHAYEGEAGHKVDIAIIIDASCFTVRIRDHGRPFDRSTYSEPDLVQLTKAGKSGGLGVHIIQRLMDHVEYQTQGRINEIRLTKYRRASDVSIG